MDYQQYISKPDKTDKTAPQLLSRRIGKQVHQMQSRREIAHYIRSIGSKGQTFCPATFHNRWRQTKNFEQTQMFVLDFDGTIDMSAIYDRTEKYGLPIFFVYETFSSEDCDRFRVVFLYDSPVKDIKAAQIIQNSLMTMFPEADENCRDIVHMYYGGKNLIYQNEYLNSDDDIPLLNVEYTVRKMTQYLKTQYGHGKYLEHVNKFAATNGIALTDKKHLDVSVVKNTDTPSNPTVSCTEHTGATDPTNPNGNFLPKCIIINKPANGEKLPSISYVIKLSENNNGVNRSAEKTAKVRTPYRSDFLAKISTKCLLYREFEGGSRKLQHNELYGIATNLIHVESGDIKFNELLSAYPFYSDDANNCAKWKNDLLYMRRNKYLPMNCDNFCPHHNTCPHSTNILSTVKPLSRTMEKIAGYVEEYHPLADVELDVKQKIRSAMNEHYTGWRIIKAQTAIGKTSIYLKLLKNTPKRILVVVPTIHLKNEVFAKAVSMGLDVIETPSLDEITEMPTDIRKHIKFLYTTGQHKLVQPYIREMATSGVECLMDYIKHKEKCLKHKGHVITTHRMLMSLDKKALDEFDVVLVDEDIILKSVIPNQVEITLSDLNGVIKWAKNELSKKRITVFMFNKLRSKISKIQKAAEKEMLFFIDGFKWEQRKNETSENNAESAADILMPFNIPAFCEAKHFCLRKTSDEFNLKNDTLVFLQPFKFHDAQYVMVSATADGKVCEHCFGKSNVRFEVCKKVRYTGVLNQFYDETMSRDFIDKNVGVLDRIKSWSQFTNTITFKKYALGELYFGNSEGSNHIEGQNIDVIGTPHQTEFIYKLFAFSIGIDFSKDARLKTNHSVTHNGYRFQFMTYDDENLRHIQFWIIESELEQAIGRARLLRYDCTVNLYSNFPICQAVMKKSKYERT
jgi:hypothetical protein